MEKHVTSLELSKKLKELGVPQKSYFYWCSHTSYKKGTGLIKEYSVIPKSSSTVKYSNEHNNIVYSAFLSSELGEMLPENTNTFKEPVGKKEWVCTRNEPREMISRRADAEANARAKMLIYLIENKLLDVKNIK